MGALLEEDAEADDEFWGQAALAEVGKHGPVPYGHAVHLRARWLC